jgi:hypothetical protein
MRAQKLEQRRFFGVVGLRRIAGRGTNAAIFFFESRLIGQRLVGGVAPSP